MGDENNGIAPAFSRSGKTSRTPPPAQTQPQPDQSHILDPTNQSCTMCMNFDTLEMVQCNDCKGWLHFGCAGVTAEVAAPEMEFICKQCSANKSVATQQESDRRSRKSKSSLSSTARSEARRKQQLELERLEEERKLREAREKEYLDKKYETLGKYILIDGSDTDSEDDRVTQAGAKEYTSEWVNKQRTRTNEAETTQTGNVNEYSQETNDLVDVSIPLDDKEVEQFSQARSQVNKQTSVSERMQKSSTVPDGESHRAQPSEFPTKSTFTVPVSVEAIPRESTNEFMLQNSTFRTSPHPRKQETVKTLTRAPVTSSWDEIVPFESPIVSSKNQSTVQPSQPHNLNQTSNNPFVSQPNFATNFQTTTQTGSINSVSVTSNMKYSGATTTVARNQVQVVKSNVIVQSSAPINQRPSTIQQSSAINCNPTSIVSHATQLPGQHYMGGDRLVKTTANDSTIVSVNQIPQLTSYINDPVHSAPHTSQTVSTQLNANYQPVGRNPVTSNNVMVSSQIPYVVNNPSTSWNVQSSNGPNFGRQQQQSSTVVTNTSVPWSFGSSTSSQQRPPMNSTVYQPLSFYDGYAHSSQPMASIASNEDTQPIVFHRSNPYYTNVHTSQPMITSSRQHLANENLYSGTAANLSNFPLTIGTRLTQDHIAARQVIGKKLPVFYGDVEKFPSWISTYELSTEVCGLTDAENLSRLQESVKGIARDFIEHQLCYPDDVPIVIETLKMLFGKPEYIIEKIMEKIAKQAAPRAEDLQAIVKFSMSVQNICGTIRAAKLEDHLRNPNMMKQLVDKLPASLQLQWAFHIQNLPDANLDTLGKWLFELAKLASAVSGPPKMKKENQNMNQKQSNQRKSDDSSEKEFINAQIENPTAAKTSPTSKGVRKCYVCSQTSCQRVKDCKKFASLNIKDRLALVKELELCIRCFGKHRFKSCRSKKTCGMGGCQKPHNPLLHESENKVIKSDTKEKTEGDNASTNVNCSHQSISRKVDIFRIVPVKLHHNGRFVHTFAYLDDGSNVTTMEEKLADELDLECSANENLCVKWSFGKISRTELVSRRVSVQISGTFDNAPVYDLHNVRTVTDLALPHQTITSTWLTSYKHFQDIPVATYENARPQILIGLQYSKLMVSLKTVEGLWSEPIACKTRLGWVVQGPDGNRNSMMEHTYSVNICECESTENSELHTLVKNFFSWEDYGAKSTNELIESNDIKRARRILESTTKKINGRYESGLLWRFDEFQFPNSYHMALKRLECLERKMEKDPVLARKMCEYIQDFVEKKYVRKLSSNELQQSTSKVWYLPIFPVFNPKKPEKFRVVWDAAAMVNKVSLNEMLLAGPDLLKPLPDILRRFREKQIAIVGDMKEMFHQVRVIDSDVHTQRFLWRDGNSNKAPEVFVILVLTFGGKNSPCSAQYVKNKNAMEYSNEFPRAVDAILNSHYQDDMLDSFDTIEETVRTTEEVKSIHRSGGFEIRNFMSNSDEVLKRLGEMNESRQMNLDISSQSTIERVLGMFWNTSTDTFTFSLKFTKISEDVLRGSRRPTKREVLSAIMSIFDPLGLIAQYIVYGKILLQKIWRDGTDWDQKLSDSSYDHWRAWIEVLPDIEKIEIPRWYSPKLMSANRKRIQLHIFVDAGEQACAAVVFCRIEDEEGIDCSLMGAKTKVAPTKPLSIPRLELQAAVLGVRLVDNISKSQRFEASERFFWSDSQTVLGWIQSEARKYHQYVAFRIGEILETSSPNEWNWVDTKNNVADDATKWEKKPNLSSSSRWYKGPSFLYQRRENWLFGKEKEKFSTEEEMRAVYLLAHIEMPNNDIIDAKRFSNWHRLVRSMAFVLRFVENLKLRKKERKFGPFSREEYIRARIVLFKQSQREEFLDEILVIRNNESVGVSQRKELHRSSLLRKCSPYLDEDGLLRVKGRIDAAKTVTFNTKRPIILSRQNYITKLLILSYHRKLHHLNHQSTLNQIKQTFEIPALRVGLKGVIENLCQRCKNDKAKPMIPEMAELPLERLATFERPFTYVGVDYFGPIKVKVRRSPEKRWGVIFTCLTTRAAYIDIAHSLDTSSCIFCIRNFSNRCGPPSKYHSDNGGNFHGAETELREEFQKMNKRKIEETFTDEHTQWSFNPPTAAHMGGVWERPIRIIKSVLKKMLPTRLPTDEMLKSYLIEIENIINSIPLTYIPLDDVDDEVLTPNHFLKGSAIGRKSPGLFGPRDLCRDDWRAVQEQTNQFWRQFVVEYIPTLTRRTKWFKTVKNLEVGDLVIDCDESSNRNEWRKAIVEEVAIGKGNQVRRAKVRMIRGEKSKLALTDITDTKHQSLWRPVAKLAILDVKSKLNVPPEAINKEGNVVNAS